MSSRPSHLSRRGAIYLVRFRIPTSLSRPLGVAELRRSLRTANPRQARERALIATVWFRELMDRFETMATPSRFDLEQARTAFFKELTEELDSPRPFDPEHFDDDVRFNVDCSRERTRELDDQLRSNIFDNSVRSKAAELSSSLAVQDADPSMRLYALQLAAHAEREQLALHIHLLTSPPAALCIMISFSTLMTVVKQPLPDRSRISLSVRETSAAATLQPAERAADLVKPPPSTSSDVATVDRLKRPAVRRRPLVFTALAASRTAGLDEIGLIAVIRAW